MPGTPIDSDHPELAEERLRAAVTAVGLTGEELAERLQVDARTVRRWLSGQTPYTRHRLAIAKALGKDEADIWPELAARVPATERYGDLEGAWVRPTADGVPRWHQLFTEATNTIELCDYSLLDILETPGAPQRLASKATAGATVKLIISSLDSLWLTLDDWPPDTRRGFASEGPLITAIRQAHKRLHVLTTTSPVEARQVLTPRCPAILRFDERMLVALPLWGAQRNGAPILHLHHHTQDGLFEAFTKHFQALWETGWSIHEVPREPSPNPAPRLQSAGSPEPVRRPMFAPYGRRPTPPRPWRDA